MQCRFISDVPEMFQDTDGSKAMDTFKPVEVMIEDSGTTSIEGQGPLSSLVVNTTPPMSTKNIATSREDSSTNLYRSKEVDPASIQPIIAEDQPQQPHSLPLRDPEAVSFRLAHRTNHRLFTSAARHFPPKAGASSTSRDKIAGNTLLRRDLKGHIQKVIAVAGVEGKLSLLNEIATRYNARAIIHTGNFGFYDKDSWKALSANGLKIALKRKPGVSAAMELSEQQLKQEASHEGSLSELSDFIAGKMRFNVPVYVIWGQCEDIGVIEKFRAGVYHIPNLYILDHRNSYAISTGYITLRLFGLGGSFNYNKLFDVGQGSDVVSGAEGFAWANLIQMGELIEMAERYADQQEIRLFITQCSPSKEALAHCIATEIRADFTISYNTESKVCSIYDDSTIHTTLSLKAFLLPTREDIKSLWDQIYFACHENFAEPQKKSANRLINCLTKEITNLRTQSCIHIGLASIRYGELKFSLGESEVSLETIFHYTAGERGEFGEKGQQSSKSLQDTHHLSAEDISLGSPGSGKHPSSETKSSYDDQGQSPRKLLERLPRMFIGNLPFDISGKEVDDFVLSKYDIVEIEFKSPRNNTAVVKFKTQREMEKAISELRNFKFGGRELKVSRYLQHTPVRDVKRIGINNSGGVPFDHYANHGSCSSSQ